MSGSSAKRVVKKVQRDRRRKLKIYTLHDRWELFVLPKIKRYTICLVAGHAWRPKMNCFLCKRCDESKPR